MQVGATRHITNFSLALVDVTVRLTTAQSESHYSTQHTAVYGYCIICNLYIGLYNLGMEIAR